MGDYLCSGTDCEDVCNGITDSADIICLKCGDTDDSSFNSGWSDTSCQNTITKLGGTFNGLQEAQMRTNRVLSLMMGADGSTLNAGGVDSAQNSVLGMCLNQSTPVPGACDNYITNVLSINPLYTYDTLIGNVGIASWLGCYLSPPSDEANTYNSSLGSSVTPDSCSYLNGFPWLCFYIKPNTTRNIFSKYWSEYPGIRALSTVITHNKNIVIWDNQRFSFLNISFVPKIGGGRNVVFIN